jgi:hypothetical protein
MTAPISALRGLPRAIAVAITILSSLPASTRGQCTGCPNASFGPAPHIFEGGDRQYDIVTGDFDRDGFLDVAATQSDTNGFVLVFLGNGRGGFAEPLRFPAGDYPQSLTSGDFNGDGFPDLAFTFGNHPTVGVLIGQGGGQFAPLRGVLGGRRLPPGEGRVGRLQRRSFLGSRGHEQQ